MSLGHVLRANLSRVNLRSLPICLALTFMPSLLFLLRCLLRKEVVFLHLPPTFCQTAAPVGDPSFPALIIYSRCWYIRSNDLSLDIPFRWYA